MSRVAGHPRVPAVAVDAVPDLPAADLVVLDVREVAEWVAGHIPGALHIPLLALPGRLAELPANHRVLCICRVGARSEQATAFLRAHSVQAVNLAGGMNAWHAASRAMVSETPAAPTVL